MSAARSVVWAMLLGVRTAVTWKVDLDWSDNMIATERSC